MEFISEDYLAHYGRSKRDGAKKGSGRYPLGSGENPRAAKRSGVIPPVLTVQNPWDVVPAFSEKGYNKKAQKHAALVEKYRTKAANATTDLKSDFYNERANREQQRSNSYKKSAHVEADSAVSRGIRRMEKFRSETWNETVTNIYSKETMTRTVDEGRKAIEEFRRQQQYRYYH